MRSTIMFNDEYIPEWITINRIWYNIFQSFSIDEITEDGGNSKRKASKKGEFSIGIVQ